MSDPMDRRGRNTKECLRNVDSWNSDGGNPTYLCRDAALVGRQKSRGFSRKFILGNHVPGVLHYVTVKGRIFVCWLNYFEDRY